MLRVLRHQPITPVVQAVTAAAAAKAPIYVFMEGDATLAKNVVAKEFALMVDNGTNAKTAVVVESVAMQEFAVNAKIAVVDQFVSTSVFVPCAKTVVVARSASTSAFAPNAKSVVHHQPPNQKVLVKNVARRHVRKRPLVVLPLVNLVECLAVKILPHLALLPHVVHRRHLHLPSNQKRNVNESLQDQHLHLLIQQQRRKQTFNLKCQQRCKDPW